MSSPQITWDAEPQQIQWDDERPGVPKPPNPVLNAPTPSALSRGATAFGAAAGDLFNAGSQMYAGGTPGESFTPQIGSPADKLAKSGDWRGAIKEGAREAQIARPGPIEELGGAVKGMANMAIDPIKRGLNGDVAGAIGEAIPNALALRSGYGKAAIPDTAAAGGAMALRTTGKVMTKSPELIGAAAGEAVGHPFLGGYILRKPIKAIGERLSRIGLPRAEETPNPFRNVPDPEADVFNVKEPPLQGEYVNSPSSPPPKTIPTVQAQEVARPQLPSVGGTSVPRDMPYRVGPGGIPAEDVNAPNPRVLAGNKGIRTTPIAALPAKAEEAPAIAAPTPVEHFPSVGPHTLSGESALRQVLTGQDNKALLQIAKSRGLNVSAESQLKPGVADSRIVGKIIDSFSPEELDEMRAKYLENTRMGRGHLGDIGAEAYKTKSLQTYFPDLKISQARLGRTAKAVDKARISPPDEGDLTGILSKSVEAAKKKKAAIAQ